MKLFIFVSILVVFSNAYAGVYKCKSNTGAISYSATPCPKGSLKKKISTLRNEQLNYNKAKIPIGEVKTIADGLSNILRGGFANENLKSLKEDYLNQKRRSTAKRLTKKGALWQQYLMVSIDPNNTRGIKISYKASRNRQAAKKLSDFEVTNEDKKFDISLMDVNVHAVRIGLKNKASETKAIGARSVEWSWFFDDFKCEMKVNIDKKDKFKNKLTYQCKYQGS